MFPWGDASTVQAPYAVGSCRNGHCNPKRDKWGNCIECRRMSVNKYKRNNRDKVNAADRANYAVDSTLAKQRDRRRYEKDFIKVALKSAKKRAEAKNLPFNITAVDVHVPTHCPVFGTELKLGVGRLSDSSPSLDKIIPSLGYIKGNVWVVSNRANRIKSDASIEELEILIAALKNRNRGFPW